jgi:hypothetical protein
MIYSKQWTKNTNIIQANVMNKKMIMYHITLPLPIKSKTVHYRR